MDIVHFSLHFHWPGGAGRSTENGDRRSDSAITPMAMIKVTEAFEAVAAKAKAKPNCLSLRLTQSQTVGM